MNFKKDDVFEIKCEFKQDGLSLLALDLKGSRVEALTFKTCPKAVQITLKDKSTKDFSSFVGLKNGFELNLQGLYEIDAIKIAFHSQNQLNAKIKIFQRKAHLIISRRFDAFGSRMFSFINAMFFAKKFGFKFGFVWDNTRLKDVEFCQTDTEDEVFSENFLKKYSYTNMNLPFTHRFENTMPASFLTMKDALKAPLYESWGHLASYYRPAWQNMKDLSEAEYKADFRSLFDSIDFSPLYKELLKQASVGFEFEAVHLRESEIVFLHKNRIFALWIYYFPAPLVVSLIKTRLEKGKKIMLFCEDKDYAADIKAHFSQKEQKKIFIASDFLPKKELSKAQNAFFELILMSKSSVIYGSVGSMFKLFASYLSNIDQITINQLFDPSTQYELLKDSIEKMKISSKYKISCYAFLHRLAVILKKDDELENILKQGLEHDKNNLGFLIKLAAFYAKKGQFSQGSSMLKKALSFDEKQTLGLLKGEYKDDMQIFSQNYDKDPLFCLVSGRFDELVGFKNECLAKTEREKALTECEKVRTECERLKKENESLKTTLKATQNKLEQSISERDKASLERDKALRFKKHLSYKLGNALVNAYKSPFHSGLVKFVFFDAWRIYREFKNLKF